MDRAMICSILFSLIAFASPELPRPRGVAISKASFYMTGADFTCLDGSATISFDRINDDYCDCNDGSDEPGTSACPAGKYHCTNAGFKPMYIPSSRVNDGICDCCDGTDEYDSDAACANTCWEAGKAAREEEERRKKLQTEGFEIYKDYVTQGQQATQEKKERLTGLEEEKSTLQYKKDELEAVKNEAETPEKEAKDKHQKAWEEEKQRKQTEKEASKVQDAFNNLDANGDQMVSVEEMMMRPEFDIDSSGEVSQEEAKEYLHQADVDDHDDDNDDDLMDGHDLVMDSQEYLEDQDQVDFETFKDQVWPNIREIYVPPTPPTQDPPTPPEEGEDTTPPPPEDQEAQEQEIPPELDDEDREIDDYDDDEDAYQDEDNGYTDEDDYIPPPPHDEEDAEDEESRNKRRRKPHRNRRKGDEDEDQMPPYDADTQALIDAADTARENFREAETKLKDVEREISDINNVLGLDLGPEKEYFPLKGNCYEYTDREYTYKLCPFERASQRSKNGGAETSLGSWGRWDGSEADKYAAMKYERGQNCWNGPDRSVRVLIECGVNNELFSASEPNRCEYQFGFRSPAACSKPPSAEEKDPDHDEL